MICQLKLKCIAWDLWVQFYLRTQDYNPGDSLSHSSEELLQRSSGGGQQAHRWLWRKGSMQSSTHLGRRLFLVTRNRYLVLFCVWKDTRNWINTIFSWKYLNCLKAPSASFPRAQSASFLIFALNAHHGVLNVRDFSGCLPSPCRARCRVTFLRWQLYEKKSFAAQLIFLLEMKEVITLMFLYFPKFLLLVLAISDKIRVDVHHPEV